jgi:hypothetical protein
VGLAALVGVGARQRLFTPCFTPEVTANTAPASPRRYPTSP